MERLVGLQDIKGKHIIWPLLAELVGTLILIYVGCGSCLVIDGMIYNTPKFETNQLQVGPITIPLEKVKALIKDPNKGKLADPSSPVKLNHDGQLASKIQNDVEAKLIKLANGRAGQGSWGNIPNNWMTTGTKAVEVVGVAFAFGITVASIAQAIGHISGAHLNPAVSIGLVAAGGCSIMKALVYIVAQCLGAILGAVLLWISVPEFGGGNLGSTTASHVLWRTKWNKTGTNGLELNFIQGYYFNSPNYAWVLVIEAFITFVLVLTVCGVVDEKKDVKGSSALAIGLAITGCHLFAVPLTGASMNPARSLGPALTYYIVGPGIPEFVKRQKYQWFDACDWPSNTPVCQLWVYWLGPIIGGIVAGIMYRFLFTAKEAHSIREAVQGINSDERLALEVNQALAVKTKNNTTRPSRPVSTTPSQYGNQPVARN